MASAIAYRRKLALVIGINTYHRDSLNFCINDATDLKTTLQRINFNVSLGQNCNLSEFYRIVDTFVETIERDDLVLFYFAGHGKQKDEGNYLLPSDYNYDYRGHEHDYIVNHAVNVQYIMNKIDDKTCRITIYLFDCCRNLVRTRATNAEQGLSPMHAPLKTLIVFACAPRKSVLDETRNNRNGSFIENLLRHIETPDKDIEELMKNVARDVELQTAGFQLPYRTSSLTSKVFLVTNNNQGSELRKTTQSQQSIEKRSAASSVSYARKNLTDCDLKIVVQQSIIGEPCKELHLELNQISSAGAAILAQVLDENNTLESLWLYDNQVADTGVYYLARTLSMNNNILKHLDLGKNKITDEGAKHLARMIAYNAMLSHLYLHENTITDIGVRILVNAIQHHNTTIEALDLSYNTLLTDKSIDPLVEMIKHHDLLKCLNVSDCCLSEKGKTLISGVELSKQNFSLII